MTTSNSFYNEFRSLTGFSPMRWQCRLFERLLKDDIPEACDIPTGLGKTSAIVLWLLALVHQARDGCVRLPRRLAYIVNRRTIVDQATATVEGMRRRLLQPEGPDWEEHAHILRGIASVLGGLSASKEPLLGVSTLRGELADNEEWKADPARPAIVIGTIDMIGSKLLFSGYGDGRYRRAHHAGLIGQDTLIIHDEAHLTPAFSDLLRRIADEQERSREPRRVRVMELSATQRDGGKGALQLEAVDETDAHTGRIVKHRLDAKKWLRLHRCDNVVQGLAEKATLHIEAKAKVLVYVRSPEDAQQVADVIRKKTGKAADERVALLTGTIRGYERDRLVNGDRVYRAMLDPESSVAETVYLVSTSAGEVGIDLDADHLVCDLTTLDAMIQRLGRVNRRGGESREARVDVIWTEQDEKPGEKASAMDKAVAATLHILQDWVNKSNGANGLLVSPRHLRTLVEELSAKDREAAFSPEPTIPPLSDILLDSWSLTSIEDMPGRREVAAYLHGLTGDPPETYVVWRKEVTLLSQSRVDESTLTDWFRACGIEARERLRDRTDRVRKTLDELLTAHRRRAPKDGEQDFPILLLDERGRARWSTLSEIVKRPERDLPDVLAYRTVVLPVEAGGLDRHGLLDGKATGPINDIDVAEKATGVGRRERWLEVRTAGGESQWRRLLSDGVAKPSSELSERERIPLKRGEEGAEDEGESTDLVLFELPEKAARESPETARVRQPLAEHTKAIQRHMEAIADRLGLEPTIKEALVAAARWHDRGKDRPVWQRYAQNDNGSEPLAKSTRYLHGRALGGYRHEFGSLLEAMADPEIAKHPERDLILHLIAAHHGWARPHFERRAFDNEGPLDRSTGERRLPTTAANEQALVEAMQRFGRLHQRFGRWGLAWLEALVRCADIAASKPAAPPSPAADGAG
ncbi:MAG: type I-U CRISPR-associated helicase/endonuclease Cas3 [Chloroflexota bacterium]